VLLVDTEIKKSEIHGIGLFTKNEIKKGTKVWEFNPLFDIKICDSHFDKLPETAHTFLKMYAYRSVETNELIVNLDLSRHMNHSDSPNLISDALSNYFAQHDIPPGTELTCDYREFSVSGVSDFCFSDALGCCKTGQGV